MADEKCPRDGEVTTLGIGNLATVHRADHRDQLCTFRAVPEGTPLLPGEEVAVREVGGGYRVVEGASGPPQVATPAYREGWERAFGRPAVGEA